MQSHKNVTNDSGAQELTAKTNRSMKT